MRLIIAILPFFLYQLGFSQTSIISESLADSGKIEFKLQAKKDTADYSKAFRILSNQVKLHPSDAELRYFLGYTIDRMNTPDGETMHLVNPTLTIKASEQFEQVNRLQPRYTGELILLDPYSKLTAIWGSLAQTYLTRKDMDSARWAFSEGKRRGGFTGPLLEFNRQLINSCDPNSILITSGDNITISLWYLQTMEGYRSDITIVDASLIHSSWYPKYLKHEKGLKLSFADVSIDTITYQIWPPQIISIYNPRDSRKVLTWELKPTYKKYLLKGDKMMLDILQQNFYERPIYFNMSSDSSYNLYLTDYLKDEGLVSRLMERKIDDPANSITIPPVIYQYNIDRISKDDIQKSADAIRLLSSYRQVFLKLINREVITGHFEKAKELILYMKMRFNEDRLPHYSTEMQHAFDHYVEQIMAIQADR